MFYIAFALFLFVSSVLVHIFFCRKTTKPGLHAKAFGLTAIIFLVIYVVGVLVLQNSSILDPRTLWGLPFKITAGVIFVLLVPAYLIFYTSTQLMSPSKKILSTISHLGNPSYADIVLGIQEEDFIGTRLSDLCVSGCVIFVDDRYHLTSSGQRIAAILDMMQFVLGRDMGG
jgi:hypothetical protein